MSTIRALRDGLGVPADILLGQGGATLPDAVDAPDWGRYPLAAMVKLGWISDGFRTVKDRAEEIMRGMLARAGECAQGNLAPLYRKNDQTYRNSKADDFALHAWRLELLGRARSRSLPRTYLDGAAMLAGEYQYRIAADFDLNQGRISEIRTGKRFADVPPAEGDYRHDAR